MKRTSKPYHYTECGLETVWLRGITFDPASGGVEIPKIAALHRRIAHELMYKDGPLTPQEFVWLAKHLSVFKAEAKAEPLQIDLSPEDWERW